MKQLSIVLALALAAGGVPAIAQESSESQAEPQREKKICRTQKMTGSLTRRTRICLTEREWRELAARTNRGVSEMQNSASGAPRCISAMDVSCGAPGPGG